MERTQYGEMDACPAMLAYCYLFGSLGLTVNPILRATQTRAQATILKTPLIGVGLPPTPTSL